MFMLTITQTGKGYSPKSEYRAFDEKTVHLATWPDVLAYIAEHYGKCKRQTMYCDKKSGEAFQAGWVFGFRNSDCSHSPVENWLQRDWVEVSEVCPVDFQAVA